MRKKITNKNKHILQDNRGIAWIFVVLLILILILLVLIFIPVYRRYRFQADEIGCVSALKTANDQLSIAYLSEGDLSAEEAKEAVDRAMDGWEDLCVGHGTVYLVETKNSEVPYQVVCGLHDKDTKEKTRLNAAYVLEQIQKEVKSFQIQGEAYPGTITVELNGKQYEAVLTDEESGFRSGTSKTSKAEGTVIRYSIVGHSSFGEDSGMHDGDVWYFTYADEEHCAIWSSLNGWSGDSYN